MDNPTFSTLDQEDLASSVDDQNDFSVSDSIDANIGSSSRVWLDRPFEREVAETLDDKEKGGKDSLRIPAEGAEEEIETTQFLTTQTDDHDISITLSPPSSPNADIGSKRPSIKLTTDSVEIELLESDPEFVEDFKAMVRNRKRSRNGSRRRKSSQRSTSDIHMDTDGHSRHGEDDQSSIQDDQETQEDTHAIRENIQIQKEIIHKVKNQPWSMRKKLKTVRLAQSYLLRYEGKLSRGHGLYKEVGIKYWEKTKRELFNFLSIFVPWEMRIKTIESHFGSIVSSYFTFLRWLLGVNIILTIITMSLVVIPEIVAGDSFGSTPRKSIPPDEIDKALNLNIIWNFEGYLKYSVLFYGYYGNAKTIGNGYRLPLAYFLVGVCTMALSFILILRRMAKNSRLSKASDKDEQFTFGWKLFTSWDYMIGNNETAKNKAAEVSTNFRESILEEEEKSRDENKNLLIALRVMANIMVVVVLTSSTYAIYVVVNRSIKIDEKIARGEEVSWLDTNMVALVTSIITAIYPSIFELIGMMEKYHPRINLRWQLARILVLYLLNLYTLVVALYWKISNKIDQINIRTTNSSLTLCSSNNDTIQDSTEPSLRTDCGITTAAATVQSQFICWETDIGQEMFKLTTFDLVITVMTIILIDFVRGLVVRYLNPCCCWDLERKFPEYGEFKIAENILHLINNQAMIWLGTFFAPVLPGLNLFKLMVMFYIRSWAVIMCNIPHERVFKASRSNNFYQALLLLMLFLITVLVIFLLVQLPPSPDCGPFSGFTNSYAVLTLLLEEEFPPWVNSVMAYVASPGVIIPLFLLFVLAVFYLISLTRSLKEVNKDLRQQLIYERTEERRKIYAMAEARIENMKGNTYTSQPQENISDLQNTGAKQTSESNLKRILKVSKLPPNITPKDIDAIKAENPNVCIVDGTAAKRLQSMAVKPDKRKTVLNMTS